MLHRNRFITGIAGGLILAAAVFTWAQENPRLRQGGKKSASQQAAEKPAVTPETPEQKGTQPTPLPPDIDLNDPALPVWLRTTAPVPKPGGAFQRRKPGIDQRPGRLPHTHGSR